jgi:hypothetical protein
MEDTAPNPIARLSQLADQLFEAESDVARLQGELRNAQARVQQLSEFTIPELMDELEMAEFKTKSGLSITVKEKLSAKKLTQAHQAALDWLRQNGQAGLIKTLVAVPFSAGSENDADALVEELAGEGFIATKNMEVHHSSLASAIKSMLADGIEVPMELLGGYQRRVANIETKK